MGSGSKYGRTNTLSETEQLVKQLGSYDKMLEISIATMCSSCEHKCMKDRPPYSCEHGCTTDRHPYVNQIMHAKEEALYAAHTAFELLKVLTSEVQVHPGRIVGEYQTRKLRTYVRCRRDSIRN